MARSTCQQRRRNRQQKQQTQQADGQQQQASVSAASAQPPGAGAPGRAAAEDADGPPRGRGWRPPLRRRVLAELKKVDWPSQRQVMTGTVVVIIACAIVGTYLALDLAIQPFVERLLLGR